MRMLPWYYTYQMPNYHVIWERYLTQWSIRVFMSAYYVYILMLNCLVTHIVYVYVFSDESNQTSAPPAKDFPIIVPIAVSAAVLVVVVVVVVVVIVVCCCRRPVTARVLS